MNLNDPVLQRKINAELAAERFWKFKTDIDQLQEQMNYIVKNYNPNIVDNKRDCESFKRRLEELALIDEFNDYTSKHCDLILVKMK